LKANDRPIDGLVAEIQQELLRNIDPAPKRGPQSFFKEEIKAHGVKSAFVEKLAAGRFREIRDRDKKEVLELCEALLQTEYVEEAFIACAWAYELRDRFVPADFATLESWLFDYIDNWAKCDTLCNHPVASFVEKYPEYVERLKGWARSDNRWVRRASAVTLILPARNGLFLKDVFEIADILLLDKDDLVQKGYGWMLKEASKPYQQEVFDYIMRNKAVMPRTALRYAIEKMPADLKKRAMAK